MSVKPNLVAAICRFVIPSAVVLAALGIYRIAAVNAAKPPVTKRDMGAIPVQPTNVEPRIATDEQLKQVLTRVLPPGKPVNTNNFIHALRLWGVQAQFDDSAIPSGAQLRDYFLDDKVFRQFAGDKAPALFYRDVDGLHARDFDEDFANRTTSSFHNDDLLATLAETGTTLDTPMHLRDSETVYVENLLHDSLKRFNPDRWEFEWSIIAFLRYRYPQREWLNEYGEKIELGQLIQMCVPRTPRENGQGPCNGQHRLEALVVLLKVDEQAKALSPANRQQLISYLKSCSDKLVASQATEGFWTPKWIEGAAGKEDAKATRDQKLLVTGHTLEWLALAPEEALPPRENIVRAGQWIVNEMVNIDEKTMVDRYGPNSHAARALCLWRGKEAWEMWQEVQGKTAPAEKPAETPSP